MSETLVSPLDGRDSLSAPEVSRLTGIPRKTLIKYAKQGLIPGAFQLGGKWSGWYFKRKPLENWWMSQGRAK